jgi:Kdo2-lipid IVA lauroyltransferase/acyltransferase
MLLWILRRAGRLPLAWLHRAGAALGWLAYWSSPSYAARLRENLYASGVCSDTTQCDALRRAAIAEAGKAVAELAAVWFGTDEQVAQRVQCGQWDVVERGRARGAGVILLTPHLGCFEISAHYAAQRVPLTVLYRPPKQHWLEPLMVAGRSRWNAKVAPADLRGVRMLYRALARGEAVGLLPDQAPGVGEGAWADFFGRPAYTMTLVTRLQQSTGAAVIMAFAERLPAGRGYRLYLEEIATDRLDETELNRAVEAQVRRRPEQYLWSYNRYKVPEGAPPPLAARAEVESRKSKV